MIQIRNGIFETNSSSANVLIIPKDQGVHVPKRFIYVDDETSLKPSEKVIYSIIHGWKSNTEDIDAIVNFLYLNGVEEIIYGGRDRYFENAIEKYKDNPIDLGLPKGWSKEKLIRAIFGPDSEIVYCSDGDPRPNYGPAPEYKRLDFDDENWYEEYSAD